MTQFSSSIGKALSGIVNADTLDALQENDQFHNALQTQNLKTVTDEEDAATLDKAELFELSIQIEALLHNAQSPEERAQYQQALQDIEEKIASFESQHNAKISEEYHDIISAYDNNPAALMTAFNELDQEGQEDILRYYYHNNNFLMMRSIIQFMGVEDMEDFLLEIAENA